MQGKELALEIIGLILFIIDQISDIIVLAQGDFYNEGIEISMYVVFIFNMTLIFSLFGFRNIIYTNFFAFKLTKKQSIKQRQSTKDYIIHYTMLLCAYLGKTIAAIFWYIILTLTQMIIIWFGLYRLYHTSPMITDILSHFLFLSEQNQWLLQQELQKCQQQQQSEMQPLQLEQPQLQQNEEQHQKQPQSQQQKEISQQQIQDTEQSQQQQNQPQQQQQTQKEEEKEEEHDEKQYEMKNSKLFCQKMKIMCFRLELIEKILENFPQLILQTINISLKGDDVTISQKLSIISSVLDILINIIVAISYRQKALRQLIEKIMQVIQKILQILPYIEFIQILQFIFYIFITASYKWEDYLLYEDTETYGKDLHDSVRAFIIIFPFAWLINTGITSYHQCKKKSVDLKGHHFLKIVPLLLKSAVIVQICFDLLVFSSPPFEYGQSIIGYKNMNLLMIIIIISQLFETGLFYQKIIENNKNNAIKLAKAYVAGIILFIFEIKTFSHWVNLAHYYDWTDLDYKLTFTIGKCDEAFEKLIRGYIITFILSWFGRNTVLYSLVKKNDSVLLLYFNILFISFIFCYMLIALIYLIFRIQNTFCDELQFVQKQEYTSLSMSLIIYSIIIRVFFKKYPIEQVLKIN